MMNKRILCVLSFVLAFFVLVGCSNDSQETVSNGSSVPQKEEVELVLEQTPWQLEGVDGYLLFTNDKRVTIYDFSQLDGENQEVGKFLTYETGKNEQGLQTITISYLHTDRDTTLFTYNKQSELFQSSDNSILRSSSVSAFANDFIKKIKEAESKGMDEFASQAEMNVRSGVLCGYWNELHEALKMHLKTILTNDKYETFMQETKSFEIQRDTAVQEAGKEVEGGSLYPVVTGGAYCTQTEKEIQRILTKYFS